MKKKNIAWLLSAAVILTTAATPLEIMPVYAAEEFQADETEEAGTAETTATTAADVAEDTTENGPVENATAETAESEETVNAEPNTEEAEETADEVSGENTQDDNNSDLEIFDDSAEKLNEEAEVDSSNTAETETDAGSGFSDGETRKAVTDESSEVVDSGKCGTDATYMLYGDGRLVIEGSGVVNEYFHSITDSNKKIRSAEIGEGITALKGSEGVGVFAYCSDLISVTLPKSLTTLGDWTFSYCKNLNNISIPQGVTTIERRTFYECSGLQNVVLQEGITTIGQYAFENCSSLSSINIPKSVTSIKWGAFRSCKNLDNIILAENLITIEENAFCNCSSLSSINIPQGVTSIGAFAFGNCSKLGNSIVLPDSLTTLGNEAFKNCENLSNVILSKNLKSVEANTFYNCNSLTAIEIPEGVTSIGDAAFYNCTTMSSVIFPNSLTSMGNSAFYNTGIKEISLPDNLTDIGKRVFSSCSDLRNVKLPSELKRINDSMFSDCKRLNSIELPDSIAEIGEYAFGRCARLTEINLPAGLTTIEAGAFNSTGITEFDLPNGLKTIGDKAFEYGKYSTIVIPESVTDIGESAFARSHNLKNIELPDNITEIKANTFNNDEMLESVKLPESRKTIGENAFTWCWSIASLEIPDSVTEIGEYAFEYCSNLEKISLPKELTSIAYGTFSSCSKLADISIPENVILIDTDAFKDCQALRSVYISGDSVKIGKRAIGYNSNTEKNSTLVIIGRKDSAVEIYATENGFVFHNVEDPLTHYARVESTCINDGNIEYWHCDVCGKDFGNEEGTVLSGETKIKKLKHKFTRIDRKDATCTEDGNIDYWHCERCGKNYDDTYNGKELESVIYPATGHNLEFIPGVVADCQNEGRYDYYYCNNCGKFFLDQEGKQEVTSQDLVIPEDKNNHNIRCEKGYEATCVREGMKTYYICNNCRKLFLDENGTQEVTEAELIIPRNENHRLMFCPGRAADCGNSGQIDYYHCGECGKDFRDKEAKEEVTQDSDLFIPPTDHKWSAWKLIPMNGYAQGFPAGKSCQIDIISDYLKERKCERCGQTEGKGLTYAIHVNTDRITLKYGQSTTSVRASGFKNGDYLKSVTPKIKDLVTISNINRNGTFKVTAKKKSGSTRVTIKLNSGMSADILVTVQKGNVSTRYITNLRSTSIVKGETVTLKPMLDPITSQDKVTYSTSDKNIATVTSGGVVTGKQVGSAKITVKAGSKKAVVTIKVMPKVKTTTLTGVPKTKTVTRGKNFTIKAAASPRNTDEKITYKSSNSKIATVTSKGVVKGIRKGTATITVQSGSKKLTCKVTVK